MGLARLESETDHCPVPDLISEARRRGGGEEIVDDLDEFRGLFEEGHVAAFFEDDEFRSGNGLVNFVGDHRRDVHVEAPAHD